MNDWTDDAGKVDKFFDTKGDEALEKYTCNMMQDVISKYHHELDMDNVSTFIERDIAKRICDIIPDKYTEVDLAVSVGSKYISAIAEFMKDGQTMMVVIHEETRTPEKALPFVHGLRKTINRPYTTECFEAARREESLEDFKQRHGNHPMAKFNGYDDDGNYMPESLNVDFVNPSNKFIAKCRAYEAARKKAVEEGTIVDVIVPTADMYPRGSLVETLPGGKTITEMSDVEYFQQKVRRGLKVPKEEAINIEVGEIDIKLNKWLEENNLGGWAEKIKKANGKTPIEDIRDAHREAKARSVCKPSSEGAPVSRESLQTAQMLVDTFYDGHPDRGVNSCNKPEFYTPEYNPYADGPSAACGDFGYPKSRIFASLPKLEPTSDEVEVAKTNHLGIVHNPNHDYSNLSSLDIAMAEKPIDNKGTSGWAHEYTTTYDELWSAPAGLNRGNLAAVTESNEIEFTLDDLEELADLINNIESEVMTFA